MAEPVGTECLADEERRTPTSGKLNPARRAADARSSIAAPALEGRALAFLSSMASSGPSSSGDKSPQVSLAFGAGAETCWNMSCMNDSASNGSLPAKSWNATTPSE